MKKWMLALLALLCLSLCGSALALSAGDTVVFGAYPQDGAAAEPLLWRVLDVQGDRALLITDRVIDAMSFSDKNPAYWENSEIRRWMNANFMEEAFTDDERAKLVAVDVPDSDATQTPTTTTDYFYALSNEEVARYFATDAARAAQATGRARAKGIHEANGNCWWWLRSKSDMYKLFGDVFAHVETDGSVYVRGASANRAGKDNIGVRPAGWVLVSALTGDEEAPAEEAPAEKAAAEEAPAEEAAAEEAPAEEAPAEAATAAKGQLAEGVNPVYAMSFGAGVLMSRGYTPDMAALMDLEGIAQQAQDGCVSITADPFVIVVDCPNDPDRTERISVGVQRIDEEVSSNLALVYGRYLTEMTDMNDDQALEAINKLLADEGDLLAGRTVVVNGYDLTMKADANGEVPFQFQLAVHTQGEEAPVETAANGIQFRGMPFGTSYADFCARLDADGLTPSASLRAISSWEVYAKDGDLVSETKIEDGGFSCSIRSIPEDFAVAGFKVDSLQASFLKDFDEDAVYDDMDRSTLLKASYTFRITDLDASYDILSTKLSTLYGPGEEQSDSTAWFSTGGDYSEYVTWTTWYGDDNTGVYLVKHWEIYDEGNRPKEQSLWLCYGASDSVARIEALRAAFAREEMKKSADMNDLSGL